MTNTKIIGIYGTGAVALGLIAIFVFDYTRPSNIEKRRENRAERAWNYAMESSRVENIKRDKKFQIQLNHVREFETLYDEYVEIWNTGIGIKIV